MKGLFVKDLIIVKNQSKSLLAFLALGFFMSMSMKDNAGIVYMAMIISMFSLSTIGYDEFDNGFRFLFTLPASKKAYVREKYLFFILCLVIGIVAGCLIGFPAELLKDTGSVQNYLDTLGESIIGSVCVGAIYAGLLIPIRVKYDAEKAKLVNFAVLGGIAAVCYFLFKMKDKLPEGFAAKVIEFLEGLSDVQIASILIAGSIVILLVSEVIAERIIAKKEYS
ncbi:MAG: ABC-2 transporter permease [Lachnospiraceae bacterium]|nr:ABC-2 transporter permease [Lachnospiraceae bacterium]